MIDVTPVNSAEQVLRASQPVLGQIADEHPGLRVVRLNVDEEPGLAERYGVLSIPVIVCSDGGEPSRAFAGLKPEPVLNRGLGLRRPSASRSGQV